MTRPLYWWFKNYYKKFDMNYLLKILLTGSILFFSFAEMCAQFSISAQLRPRLEFRDGFRSPKAADSKSAFFVSQRTRLILDFKNEKLRLFVSPQDVRVWGQEKQVGKDPSFGLHEGWGQLKVSDIFSIKAGRQELVYDGHRLLGNLDWLHQARSHDALLFKINTEKLKLDFGGAFNQSAERVFGLDYRSDNYKVLSLVHAQQKFENFSWGAISILDGYEKSETDSDLFWRYSIGTLLGYKINSLNLEGSFYWQSGTTRDEMDIAAYLFNLKALYKFNKASVAAGLDFVSGDNPGDDKFQAFNTLYATNHKFYGWMDYFLNIPVDTKGGGLADFYANVNFSAGSKASFKIFLHYFMLANDVRDELRPTENIDRYLGTEVDVVFILKIAPYAKLQTGLSASLISDSMVQIKGTGDKDEINSWGWVMLALTPELFNSKNKK